MFTFIWWNECLQLTFILIFQLRVLKLAKSWTTMSSLLSATAKSLGAFGNLALIMCIVLYMFAVTGMQLFGKSYTPDVFGSSIPRWNFTDFAHSFMLIFRVVCGEWIEPLWDCMRASHPGALLLFIPAFVMGNFLVSLTLNFTCTVVVQFLLKRFPYNHGTIPHVFLLWNEIWNDPNSLFV